jgi:hypothetical protein
MTAKDTLEAFYRAVASGDVPTVLGLLDDNVEWTEAAGFPYAGTYHGTQAVLDGVFTRVAGEWDGFESEPSLLVAEGDEVVSLGTYRGTYRATGRSFSARFAHSVTVKAGKIVRFEQVVDTAEVNKAR